LKRAKLSELKGGSCAANVAIARSILAGEEGPKRDIVLANASAALVAAGKAADFLAGVQLAAESIDSGNARAKVEALVEFSHR
jgi:anthranilate phosphoribosyltransferase